jgi:deoxyribonuclease IV
MWKAAPPTPVAAAALIEARRRLGLAPMVVHAGYLINLAGANPVVREHSIGAFRAELERAAAIGAEYLVVHPGSYAGRTVETAIEAAATGLAAAAHGLTGPLPEVLLENTAGAGSQLGSAFEQLRELRERSVALSGLAIGYCLDTCHLLAAGFDVATAQGLRSTIASADRILGLDRVHIIHANDSAGALSSHRDRHANIGEGHIGLDGFRRILAHPGLRSKPFILETPVDEPGDDQRNLDTLRSLAPKK